MSYWRYISDMDLMDYGWIRVNGLYENGTEDESGKKIRLSKEEVLIYLGLIY